MITKKKKGNQKKRVKGVKYALKPRGALGAGMAYAMVAILVIMAAGALMIGNIFPDVTSVTNGQSVVITTNTPEPRKSNLQLYTFPGATYTPTPSATPTPEPQKQFPVGKKSGGGSTCFPRGTKILMADGTQKNIEAVSVGNQILGYDTHSRTLHPETVLQIESPIRDHLYILTFNDGTVLKLTREHPIYSFNGWESLSPQSTAQENPHLIVGTLHIGDLILNSRKTFVTLASITYVPGNVQTYNLKEVTGFNDFFANSILAHNKGAGGQTQSIAR